MTLFIDLATSEGLDIPFHDDINDVKLTIPITTLKHLSHWKPWEIDYIANFTNNIALILVGVIYGHWHVSGWGQLSELLPNVDVRRTEGE